MFALSYKLLSVYVKTEKVVVASRHLEPYQKISVSDIKVVDLPLKGIHPESIRKPEDLIGNYTICPLFAGQIVLAGHVMSSRSQPGISIEIPVEERAIFVPADASRAVGGLINPGDRVDLIWSARGASVYQPGDLHGAVTVMGRARVVRVIHDKSGEFKGVVIAAPPGTCARSLTTWKQAAFIWLWCLGTRQGTVYRLIRRFGLGNDSKNFGIDCG